MSSQNFLMNNYKKSMTANMKELNRLAEGDLEMQQLLLNAANNFVDERQKVLESGSSLHEQAQAKKRRTSGASAAAAAADAGAGAGDHGPDYEPPPTIAADAPPLRRGLRVYRGWGPRLLHQLLCTLEPNKSKMWKQLTKQQCQECLEFALDIRFFGDTLDRIGCENQKQLFQQLQDFQIINTLKC